MDWTWYLFRFDGRINRAKLWLGGLVLLGVMMTLGLVIVAIHSVPGLRHYNPIGSVHGGYAAILLDSAMGLAVQSTLPAGTGYATLEFKISFVRGMSETSGVIRTEGRVLNAGRRVATAEARITDAKDRLLVHATTTCLVFEFPKGSAKG